MATAERKHEYVLVLDWQESCVVMAALKCWGTDAPGSDARAISMEVYRELNTAVEDG